MEKLRMWWETLNVLQRFSAYFAIPSTVLIMIQTILMVVGGIGDSSGNIELETEYTLDDLPEGIDISDFPDGFDIDGDGIPDIFPEDFTTSSPSLVSTTEKSEVGVILQLISFRGVLAFFAVGGWFIIGLISFGKSNLFSITLGLSIGLVIMIFIGVLLRKIKNMDYQGNMNIKNAIGLDGVVYLKIPGSLKGEGKVNVTVQGRYSEFPAVTFWEDDIATGDEIKVVAFNKNGNLVVEPKKPRRKIMED